MGLYFTQSAFHKKHGQYAKSLVELEFPRWTHASFVQPLSLETTSNLYEASVEIRLPEGGTERWHVDRESRLWTDGPREEGDKP